MECYTAEMLDEQQASHARPEQLAEQWLLLRLRLRLLVLLVMLR